MVPNAGRATAADAPQPGTAARGGRERPRLPGRKSVRAQPGRRPDDKTGHARIDFEIVGAYITQAYFFTRRQMHKTTELQEQKAALVAELRQIAQKAKAEGRDLSDEEDGRTQEGLWKCDEYD